MKVSVVTGPGETQLVDVPKPGVGATDVLVKIRACGICGSDAFYIAIGGVPPRQGHTPSGHEPAGEVVEVGNDVAGIAVGDHVVINPMAAPGGIIGNGGATGALADYLLIENAVRGTSLEIVPDHIPFEVAALNEPMAVARHGVSRPPALRAGGTPSQPKPSDKVVVFGAGPIGLGATIAFKSSPCPSGGRYPQGVSHVVVADLLPARLEKALAVDADAVINTALAAAKPGARLGVVAVHKQPVPVDFVNIMSNEITIVGSVGYPDEIFQVTKDLIANWEKYGVIVSHTIPFDNVDEALRTASTPGAADKVVVTFN